MFLRLLTAAPGGLALLLVASSAFAQPVGTPADPPEAIGRISAIAGTVTYRDVATSKARPAELNYPLTSGNAVSTEARSHAAIDIGAGRFYLDGASDVEVGALGEGTATLTLKAGALILHVMPGGQGQVFTVVTARGTARVDQPGYSEIVAGDDQHATSLTSLEGGAQLQTADGEKVVGPGRRVSLAPGNNDAVADAAAEDDFVRLVEAEATDKGENVTEAPKYVSTQATGYQDLDRYGLWEHTEEYGPVWEPQVMSDWAPYRQGHWADVKPWGATWIDDAPWGFTPFHYGRWIEIHERWAWVPGNAAMDPVYAPAVVSFFGASGAQSRNVSWVPLGPEEPYLPPYPVTINYVRVVNAPSMPQIVNVTNVNNVSQVTNVVSEVRHQPALIIDRLVNNHAATDGGGSLVFGGGGSTVGVGAPSAFQPAQPTVNAFSAPLPALITMPGTH